MNQQLYTSDVAATVLTRLFRKFLKRVFYFLVEVFVRTGPCWSFYLFGFVALVVTIHILARFATLRGRRWLFTLIVDRFRTVYDRRILSEIRGSFKFARMEPFQTRAGVSNHAHPGSAKSRCQATTSFTKFIRFLGRTMAEGAGTNEATKPAWERYDIATSSRESKFGCSGERMVYDTSDLSQRFKNDRLKRNHFVTMIDVDFHLNDWGRYANNPVACYTRIPDAVSASTPEGHYRLVDVDGTVKMEETIKGGAVWRSGLWDFSSDRVIINGKWGLTHTLSAIEKIPQPEFPGRYAVFVVPVARIWMPRSLLQALAVWLGIGPVTDNYPEMSHATNVWTDGEFVLGRFVRQAKNEKRNDIDVVSLRYKTQQDGFSTSIPHDTWRLILDETQSDPKTANLATVQARLSAYRQYEGVSKADTGHWARYFKTCAGVHREPMLINYTMDVDDEESFTDGKTAALLASPPIVEPGVSPTSCSKNDKSCVTERIIKVRNDVQPPAGSPVCVWAEEFTALVTPSKPLTPHSQEQVIEAQTRPTQKARNARYLNDGVNLEEESKVKANQKKEVYVEPKAPRNISTVPTADTVNLGRFTYSMKEHLLATFRWFMPGRNPKGTTNSIYNYCQPRKQVTETDYSKFDGTISPFLRKLEQDIMLAAFEGEDKAELAEWLKRDTQVKGRTGYGHAYQTKSSRLSGSQMTTIGNSLINAFVAYAAYRQAGFTPKQASTMIGPKYGDDGIDDIRGDFVSVAAMLGLKIKADTRDTTNFVTFCGRIYISPRTHRSSVFGPLKALRSLPVAMKGTEHSDKVNGYLAVDPQAPLVSDYARAIKRVHGYGDKHVEDFTTKQGPFPYDETLEVKTIEVLAQVMSTTSDAVLGCIADLRAATSLEDLEEIRGRYFPNDERETVKGARFVHEDTAETVKTTTLSVVNIEEWTPCVSSSTNPVEPIVEQSSSPA